MHAVETAYPATRVDAWAANSSHCQAHYHIVAEAEPDVLCRVLNLFALQQLIPQQVQALRDGDTLSIEIRSHEHNYEAGDSVLPTCTTAGYTPYFCTICADEVHRDIVPALGHNYKEKSRKKINQEAAHVEIDGFHFSLFLHAGVAAMWALSRSSWRAPMPTFP